MTRMVPRAVSRLSGDIEWARYVVTKYYNSGLKIIRWVDRVELMKPFPLNKGSGLKQGETSDSANDTFSSLHCSKGLRFPITDLIQN